LAFTVLATIATALGLALLPYYGMAYGKNDHQAITLGIKRASKYTMKILCDTSTLGQDNQ
jgi:O-antigen/teichoic acid export membrane protein